MTELISIILGKILEGSTIKTNGWKAYDALILNGYNSMTTNFLAENLTLTTSSVFGATSKDIFQNSAV